MSVDQRTLIPVEQEDAPIPLGKPAARPEPERTSLTRTARACCSAVDFTSERMLRAHAEAPQGGWRRVVYALTGGLVNLGPSAADLQRRELIARVKTPVGGCRRIAVLSRKGGVGKTTTTLMLGHTFASYRGDRVIALDGNPDAGSLGYRVRRETTNTIISLLAHREQIERTRTFAPTPARRPHDWRSSRQTMIHGSPTPCASRTSRPRYGCWRSTTT